MIYVAMKATAIHEMEKADRTLKFLNFILAKFIKFYRPSSPTIWSPPKALLVDQQFLQPGKVKAMLRQR